MFLLVVAVLLFNWPWLGEKIVGDIRTAFFYFFAAWALVIAFVAWVHMRARNNERADESQGEEGT